MMFDRYVVAAFMLLVIINGIDCMTTMYGLQLEGVIEGNHETAKLMQNFGVIETLLLKFYVILILGLVTVVAHARSSLPSWIFVGGFSFAIGYYVLIIYNNFQVIWKLLN